MQHKCAKNNIPSDRGA